MKIRTGFVTNSSSSSYICEVCGAAESGYDACLSDLGMTECENGHIFCDDHLLDASDEEKIEYVLNNKTKIARKWAGWRAPEAQIEDYIENNINGKDNEKLLEVYNDYEDEADEAPEICCPICMLQEINDETYRKYLNVKYKEDMEIIKEKRRDILGQLTYISKKYGIDTEDIKADIKKNYKRLSEIK